MITEVRSHRVQALKDHNAHGGAHIQGKKL